MALVLTDLNAVIQRELFPNVVSDTSGAQEFSNWRFTGFQSMPMGSSTVEATLSALHEPSGQLVYRRLIIPQEDLVFNRSQNEAHRVLSMIDAMLMAAMKEICATEFHVDGQLCWNQFCEECYA